MKIHGFFVSTVIITSFISTSIFAEQSPQQRWIAPYNGTGTSYDESVHALAVDSSGNIYVTCFSSNVTTGSDYTTIKYGPAGNQLWCTHYNGDADAYDGAYAIKVDNSGNVYVTGASTAIDTGQDYATIKYGPDGNQLWTTRYDFVTGNDQAHALAVDNSGNVYVTGYSAGSGSGDDYATIKYGPGGNKLWEARYSAPGSNSDSAQAIAVDNFGNVYVTGASYGTSSRHDYATIKYNSNGGQVWVLRYNGTANQTDEAHALAVDNAGNVYVTGKSAGSGTSDDYATIKYDPNGTQKWTSRYNGPANSYDWAEAMAIDNSGNVYVTGRSTGSGTGFDYVTIKYNSDGVQLWAARYNGPANGDDHAFGIAVDGSGDVYVTGYSAGNGTNADFATVKYDSSGNQLWAVRYNSPENNNDYAKDFAIDSSGNIYVAGYSAAASGASYNYTTIKYTQHDYCTGAIAGDLDSDCRVDFGDYAILAKSWLAGKNWTDLATMASNWLDCNFALSDDCL